jgi:hypothetical protein
LKKETGSLLNIVFEMDMAIDETREESLPCAIDDFCVVCIGRIVNAADEAILNGDFEVLVHRVPIEDECIDDCGLGHDVNLEL